MKACFGSINSALQAARVSRKGRLPWGLREAARTMWFSKRRTGLMASFTREDWKRVENLLPQS